MELIVNLVAIVSVVGLVWLVADSFNPRAQIININGRRFRVVGVLGDRRVKIRRTLGQYLADKYTGGRRRLLALLASIGLTACGGAEFQLADSMAPDAEQADAGPLVVDSGRPTYNDPYVDPTPEAGPDVAPSVLHDASPEADVCAPPGWTCGSTPILPGRFCINYRGVDGAPHIMQQDIPTGCNACALSCACLLSTVTCGIYNGGAVSKLVGCDEQWPNEAEVTCQQ